jgi:hypothetical protein
MQVLNLQRRRPAGSVALAVAVEFVAAACFCFLGERLCRWFSLRPLRNLL